MAESKPTVYLLHGEDDYAIAQFIQAMQQKLGDPATAEMNTSDLGPNYDLDALRRAAMAMPFLAERRLVMAASPSKRFTTDDQRAKLLAALDDLPPSTALALTEDKNLELDDRGKPVKKEHWLVAWAKQAGPERAFMKAFGVPKGADQVKWLLEYARSQGGELERPAAVRLADLFVEEPRAAAGEVDKLLAYVNYQRPIGAEDVEQLAAFYGPPPDFFKFIDTIGANDTRAALNQLERLLAEQDGLHLFFSLVGHYRALLQTRAILDEGGQDGTVATELKMHPFRAGKLAAQARRMNSASLRQIYRRLLEYNRDIVTGQLEAELALTTLVTGLTLAR